MSFANFASQYLQRQRQAGASSLAASQPLFFSFSTEDGGDRSRAHDAEHELDDVDDPHMRASTSDDGMGMGVGMGGMGWKRGPARDWCGAWNGALFPRDLRHPLHVCHLRTTGRRYEGFGEQEKDATYKKPTKNTMLKPIFLCWVTCNLKMTGKGIMNRMRSAITEKVPITIAEAAGFAHLVNAVSFQGSPCLGMQ